MPQCSLSVMTLSFPWKQSAAFDAKTSVSNVSFVRAFPDSAIVLTAEPTRLTALNIGTPSYDSLLNAIKGTARASICEVEYGIAKESPANGFDWIHVAMNGKSVALKGVTMPSLSSVPRPVTWHLWMAVRGGFFYRVVSVNEKSDEAKTDGETFIGGVQYTPFTKNSSTETALLPLDDYHGKVHGFETSLSDRGWKTWPRQHEVVPGAFWGAMHPQGSYAYVVVVPAPVGDAGLHENAFAFIRMATRFGQPEQQLKFEQVELRGADAALKFSVEQMIDSVSYHYEGWVAQGHGRLILAMSWGQLALLNSNSRLFSDTLNSIHLLTNDGLPPLSLFNQDQRMMQADVLNEIGLALHRQGSVSDAAKVFQQALEISHHNPVICESAANCLEQTGDVQGALKCIERFIDEEKSRAKSAAPTRPRLISLMARLRAANGEEDKALAMYASMFKEGSHDEESLWSYLGLLFQKEDYEASVRVMEDFVKAAPSSRTRRWLAMCNYRAKHYDKALELYTEILKQRPLDIEAASQCGECANSAGKYDVSAEMVKLLTTEKVETARVRLIEGWSLYGKKAFREAKLCFESAKLKSPNDAMVNEALTVASAALGEGDTSAVREPIEPLPLPVSVRAELDKVEKQWSAPAESGAAFLERVMHFRYAKGKRFISTIHRKVKVLDQAGVEAFSTLSIPFDPLRERIFMNHLEVRDEKGESIATGKLDDQYVVDPSIEGPATLSRVLRVPVPGLKPGRVVEYSYTSQELANAEDMPFQSFFCASPYPCAVECIVAEGDVKDIVAVGNAEFKRCAKEQSDEHLRTWLVLNPIAYRNEPSLPRYDTYLPLLRMGAAGKTWLQVGEDYLKLIATPLGAQAEIKTLAAQLTKDCHSPEDKAEVLSQYVRHEITYKAIEFGRRAMVPNAPTRILANHYGDCKDQALLLHQLLEAVGIDSHLVLANTHADIVAELPDLDQFNHMIVHVPSLKCRFIDATEGKAASTLLPPFMFARSVFVVDPKKPHLEAMPERSDFPANQLLSTRHVSFDPEGAATVDETLQLDGYLGQWMRQMLHSIEPEKRVDSLQRYMQRSTRWELDKVTAQHLEEPTLPLTLVMHYALPPRGNSAATQRFTIPAIWELDYLEPAFVKARRHPFENVNPINWQSKVTVTLPASVDAASLAAFKQQHRGEFGEWTCEATPPSAASPNEFQLSWKGTSPSGVYGAERYSLMHREMSAAVSCWDQDIRCEMKH